MENKDYKTQAAYRQEARQLSHQLTIGYRRALELLEATGGDAAQATVLFRTQALDMVARKTGLSHDQVLPYLEKCSYAAAAAIECIEDELWLLRGKSRPEVAYRLHKHRLHKAYAIDRVGRIVARRYTLDRRYPRHYEDRSHHLCEAELASITEPTHRLALCMADWLAYEDSEKFSNACLHNTATVAGQLRLLGMRELAAALCLAADIRSEYGQQHYTDYTDPGQPAITRYLYRDCEEFVLAEQYYQEQRQQMIDTLYEYLVAHADRFP